MSCNARFSTAGSLAYVDEMTRSRNGRRRYSLLDPIPVRTTPTPLAQCPPRRSPPPFILPRPWLLRFSPDIELIPDDLNRVAAPSQPLPFDRSYHAYGLAAGGTPSHVLLVETGRRTHPRDSAGQQTDLRITRIIIFHPEEEIGEHTRAAAMETRLVIERNRLPTFHLAEVALLISLAVATS